MAGACFPIDEKYKVTQPWLNPAPDIYKKTGVHPGCDWGVQGAKNVQERFIMDAEVIETIDSHKFLGNAIFYYIPQEDRTVCSFHHKEPSRWRVGDRVQCGDIVGTVGKTGLSFGEHVHAECLIGRRKQENRIAGYSSKEGIQRTSEDLNSFIIRMIAKHGKFQGGQSQTPQMHTCPVCGVRH
jgi:hypothetical protein